MTFFLARCTACGATTRTTARVREAAPRAACVGCHGPIEWTEETRARVFVAVLHDRGEISEVLGVYATSGAAQARANESARGLVWREDPDGLSGYRNPEDEWDARDLRAQVLTFEIGA